MLAEVTAIDTVANEICRDIPDGYELRLCMERGAAWVTLHNEEGDLIGLPDTGDKTMAEQMPKRCRLRGTDGEA